MNEKVDKRVVFYMTQSEKDSLKNHCDNLKRKCSNWLRIITLDRMGEVVEIEKNNDMNLEIISYRRELSANGHNLNQIAKKLNQGTKLIMLDELLIQSQIALILEQIKELKQKL